MVIYGSRLNTSSLLTWALIVYLLGRSCFSILLTFNIVEAIPILNKETCLTTIESPKSKLVTCVKPKRESLMACLVWEIRWIFIFSLFKFLFSLKNKICWYMVCSFVTSSLLVQILFSCGWLVQILGMKLCHKKLWEALMMNHLIYDGLNSQIKSHLLAVPVV